MSPPTKYLATADWHIHNWFQHSEVDAYGIPTRLHLYRELAGDVVAIGRENGCSVLLFAGDWLHYHSPKPMVQNVALECLQILADGFETVVIMEGNHDVDQKSGEYDDYHSGLRALAKGRFGNVTYVDRPGTITLGSGTTVHVRPWNHEVTDYSALEPADVFVGHGLVSGSSDPHGHVFNNGYSVPELGALYKLSVIGDIHNGQLLTDAATGNRVLIPGQPIQINHVSAENCGVWVFDDAAYAPKFVSISNDQNMLDNRYHRFLKRDAAIPGAPAWAHFRGTAASRIPGLPLATAALQTPHGADVDIPQLVKDELGELKVKDLKAASLLVDELFANYGSATPTFHIQPSQLGMVRINNFGSIAYLELDFSKVSGEVLITGPNGGGKSTILEAIFWGLTGETTKDLEVTKITRAGAKEPAEVDLSFTVGKGQYRIVRSRDTDRLLDFHSDGAVVNRGSAAETQRLIYSTLGVNDKDDVLALLYFSVKKTVNFTRMSASGQYEVLGRLVDLDFFEHFRTQAAARLAALETKRTEISARISLLTSQIEAKAGQLAALKGSSADNPHVAELAKKYGLPDGQTISSVKAALEAAVAKVRAAISPLDPNLASSKRLALAQLSAQSRERAQQADRDEAAVRANQARHASLVKNECHECHQPIPADPAALQRLLDDTRAKAQAVRAGRAFVSEAGVNAETLRMEIQRLDERAASDRELHGQANMVEFDVHQMVTYSGGYSQDLVDHIERELVSLAAAQDLAAAQLAETAADHEVLALIKVKILPKNAAINAKIYQSVFDRLVATINQLADPALVMARTEAKKGLSMQMSFRKEAWMSPKSFSTGEERLADVLTLIALNSLIYAHYGVKNGFLGFAAYDEVMTYLDPLALDAAQSAISALDCRTKLIVTHDEGLMSYYSQSVKVSKVKGVSSYQMINVAY